MDTNATVADIRDLESDLRHARANGYGAKAIRHIEQDIAERLDYLREWRRKGGFAPRDGWPKGV